MSGINKPIVALASDDDYEKMLAEWLTAAGFVCINLRDLDGGSRKQVVATLVRWPTVVDLSELPGQVILLYEQGAQLSVLSEQVSDVLELPDSQDVHSLLDWSAKLSGLLRRASSSFVVEPVKQIPSELNVGEFAEVVAAVPGRPFDDSSNDDHAPQLIAVGISTGGPASLRVFLDGLRGGRVLPPVVIVQHIPEEYVAALELRLRVQTGYDVRFAHQGLRLESGAAYIAPGNHHVVIERRKEGLYIEWDDSPPLRGHRPSVDVLFRSCLELKSGVAVIMTGMGRDGAESMKLLRDKGWKTVGQDKETCTIYGMPRAAKELGGVELELPLDRIGPWLQAYCRRSVASC
jgi:two-component system, chemotaxis family, protein-glutamate methylesterase/glutaminase